MIYLKKKTTLLVSMILLFFVATAQETNKTYTLNAQYLYNQFQKGVIESNQGSQLNASLNYNVVNETVHFLKNGQILSISEPETIKKVTIASKEFVPIGNKFYELVNNNTINLLLRREPNLRVLNKKTGGYGMDVVTGSAETMDTYNEGGVIGSRTHHINNPEKGDKEIPIDEKFYLEYKGKLAVASVGQIKSLFNVPRKELKNYIKEQKIDLDNISDLKRLTIYLENNYL